VLVGAAARREAERFSQLKRTVPPSRHDDDDNNGSLLRDRA